MKLPTFPEPCVFGALLSVLMLFMITANAPFVRRLTRSLVAAPLGPT